MGRKPAGKPAYIASKRKWYAILKGERVPLVGGDKASTEAEAYRLYAAEVARRETETPGDRMTVGYVLNQYLRHARNRVNMKAAGPGLSPATYDIHRGRLESFAGMFGGLPMRDLRPQHVTDWLNRMRVPRPTKNGKRTAKWTDGTVEQGRSVLRTAFRWAKAEAGLITEHPFDRAGGTVPPLARRARRPSDARPAISERDHALILEQADRRAHADFGSLVRLLYGTGARPAEMYGATAAEWDAAAGTFVIAPDASNYGRYKGAHLGVERVVRVPASLVPLAAAQVEKYPTGPVFRTEAGTPWDESRLCARMTSIKRAASRAAAARGEPPVNPRVTAYSWRHAFVTRWITSTNPEHTIARLCALLATSEEMIRRHYNHLLGDSDALQSSLDSFVV